MTFPQEHTWQWGVMVAMLYYTLRYLYHSICKAIRRYKRHKLAKAKEARNLAEYRELEKEELAAKVAKAGGTIS